MNKRLSTLLLASFILFSFALCKIENLKETPSIVPIIGKYQLSNGGFKSSENDIAASLEATSNAIFLTSLYGLQSRINTVDALRFIQSLENGDHGYGNYQGLASDVESTRYAIFSYQNLKVTIPNSINVAEYIQSLYHKDSGQFGSRANSKGDLRSTAFAVQILKALNIQDGTYLKSITPSIHQILKRLQKDNNEESSFQESSSFDTSSNYYGILLASMLGYEFTNASKWISYIASYQSPDGGFYTDKSRKEVSLESTVHAVASLKLLNADFEIIDIDSLISYIKQSPSDLKSTASSHLIFALIGYSLKPTVSYQVDTKGGIIDNTIIQGVRVKPVIFISSAVGSLNPNLTVKVSIISPMGNPILNLLWDSEKQCYVSVFPFESSNILGPVKFEFHIHGNVAELGGLEIYISDTKTIGYGVTVAASANYAGKDISEGDTIGVGTEIKLAYNLHNQTEPAFVSGEFDLIFSILDSSLVTVYQEIINGREKRNSINFAYIIKSASIPAGELTCRFEVKANEVVHTVKDVVYNFGIMMFATEINFDKKGRDAQYKIGEIAQVSFVPASSPDLRTFYTYTSKNAESRTFYLDISSHGGILIRSIAGVQDMSSKDFLKYTFSFVIDPLIENIGIHLVTFRYVTSNQKNIHLNNYDSVTKELFEDIALSFSVVAELHVTNIQEKPSKNDFFYGNEINYKFQVKDAISGKIVVSGKIETANVFLEVKHQTGQDKSFVSTIQPASLYLEGGNPQGFFIEWVINPNAISGAGVLSVVAKNVDGQTIELYEEKQKTPLSLNINIGGNIDVNFHSHHYVLETQSSTFLVDFNLKCQDKSLKNAQLRAVVSFKNEEESSFRDLFQLPVAFNKDGQYETSWTSPHDKTPTGEYRLQFYREVDRVRSSEKKKDSEDAAPLFELKISHTASPTGQLPVRTEFMMVIILAITFGRAYWKKSQYSK